ncbi:MAG: phosphoribosylformylglycinamidine synthase subunit PurL [Candidatus Micrarchaeota archaeon]|nr:phosphoribosylformylglycinamidine synthase subunit PurL [Candidatus Micrarchaeota archaeon]
MGVYSSQSDSFEFYSINLLAASGPELEKISRERGLALNPREMQLVQEHFKRLGRSPTDVELEAIAQTWSEHCGHKTFKGRFETPDGAVDNIFKTYIANATKKINAPWCVSVFEDNAGIVEFEGDYAVAFKAETHNHPSALEPFGGAATGVGGVIRDILGVWADPIANTDVLCFGPLDLPPEKVPAGSKHPRYIYSGVVAGVGAYGNNMGIPTVNGGVFFHDSYAGNVLVFCGCVGLLKKSKFVKATKAGDAVLLVGGRTGRDGIHGVTFASEELHEKSEEVSRTAVQIGDPIEEEKVKRAIMRVCEEGLASGITDLGGGGLSSAVPEMAERSGCGVAVNLDTVPLKYPVNAPWEIWVSESQERMLLSVAKKNLAKVKKIFEDEEVEAVSIGEFNTSGKLSISFKGTTVADLALDFLFTQPTGVKKAEWSKKEFSDPVLQEPADLAQPLKKILSSPNVCSKEPVIRSYDHEVKGNTVIKPLQGIQWDGPGDAAVLKPLRDSFKGITISNGMNPEYGALSVYDMAASAIDEAIRNNVAVGGRRIALLDNFSWGSPDKPDRAGGLIQAARACHDYSLAFGTPFISGKDSLYNESPAGPVTPTLLISAIGIIPDVRKAVTMDFKKPGSSLYLAGETKAEMGGSHYYKVMGLNWGRPPTVDAPKALKTFTSVTAAIDAGLVAACHDLSEGGLAVALAESAFAGACGAEVELEKVPGAKTLGRNDQILFSESNSRFIIEAVKGKEKELEAVFKKNGAALARVGQTTNTQTLSITGITGRQAVSTDLAGLKTAWKNGLK